jgi:predicted HTH domain antitoxin
MYEQIELRVQANTIILKIPEELEDICQQAGPDLQKDLKLYVAIHLYQKAFISIGKAAQIAGMKRGDFETFLSEHEIPVSNLTIADVMADIEKMRVLQETT